MGHISTIRLVTWIISISACLFSLNSYSQKSYGLNEDPVRVSSLISKSDPALYFPNELTGEILHIDLDLNKEDFAEIVIQDAAGEVKAIIPGRIYPAGKSPVSLSVHYLKSGAYCFTIRNKDKVFYEIPFFKL